VSEKVIRKALSGTKLWYLPEHLLYVFWTVAVLVTLLVIVFFFSLLFFFLKFLFFSFSFIAFFTGVSRQRSQRTDETDRSLLVVALWLLPGLL
jgi:hypothetical protein